MKNKQTEETTPISQNRNAIITKFPPPYPSDLLCISEIDVTAMMNAV